MHRLNTSVLLVAALSSAPALAASPVIAIIDPGKSDRVPLLEAKLAAQSGITLVERAAVEAVLKEQQLQAAFGPQGVGERMRLGKVLKADLLLIIRPVDKAEPPCVEFTASETRSGLRLLVRALPTTSDAAADASLVMDAARARRSRSTRRRSATWWQCRPS